LIEAFLPGVQSVLGDSDQGGKVAGRQAAAQPGVEDEQPLFGREGIVRIDRLAERSFSLLTAAAQQW
jgi:hypothetical protein